MSDKKDKVLDLPMRKVYALDILRGEKVREYRLFTDHWATRLGEFNDPDDPDMMTDIKHFDRAHFHPYNKSWWLDVEITAIDIFTVNEAFLHDLGSEVNARIGDGIFVISLGKVIGTNLEDTKSKK